MCDKPFVSRNQTKKHLHSPNAGNRKNKDIIYMYRNSGIKGITAVRSYPREPSGCHKRYVALLPQAAPEDPTPPSGTDKLLQSNDTEHRLSERNGSPEAALHKAGRLTAVGLLSCLFPGLPACFCVGSQTV